MSCSVAYVLDVRRLRVLLAVAEHGGVAAAARALSFTAPAVSQQLAALERQLDVALVDRSGRTAVLTAPGQRLAEQARAVLALLEAAEADLADHTGAPRGVLRIGSAPTLGRALLPGVLARLAVVAPQLDLRIEQLEPEDSLVALARGDLDLALAGEYALTPRRAQVGVERLDLVTEPVHVAVHAGHPLADGHDVHLSDLRTERWIAPATGSSCALLLERSCAIAGYEPHVVARCADFAMATALVAAGHGVTLLPACAATDPPPKVRLLHALDPPIRRTLYAATRPGTRRQPILACLLDTLAAQAQHLVTVAS